MLLFESLRGRDCDKTETIFTDKRTKRTSAPSSLSVSLLKQQQEAGPLSPSSTCSLTHCQLRFPWGAQRGQRVHWRTGRHWCCCGERFNSLCCSVSTGTHDSSLSFKYKHINVHTIKLTAQADICCWKAFQTAKSIPIVSMWGSHFWSFVSCAAPV